MKAKERAICSLCNLTIWVGDDITWQRFGPNKGKKMHSECYNKPRTITAKFASRCRVCNRSIAVGDTCELNSSKPTGKKIRCTHCRDANRDIEIVTKDKPKSNPFDADTDEPTKPEIQDVALTDDDTNPNTDDASDDELLTDAETNKVFDSKTNHYNYDKLKTYISAGIHTFLYGEAGSGKSHSAQLLADELGVPFYFIALTPQTPVTTLSGYMDGFGRAVNTVVYEWVKNGGILLLDELDNAFNPTLIWFNNGLASGWFQFPTEKEPIKKHANAYVVAAANTPGLGPTPEYMDRRPIDESVRSRYAFIEWNTDLELEKKIAANISTPVTKVACEKWVTFVQTARVWAKTNIPALKVTQRSTIIGCQLINAGVKDVNELIDASIVKGASKENRDKFMVNIGRTASI